jgi:LemA protein
MTVALLVALGLVALILLWALLTYNRLVRLRNEAASGWSGIDVQLKRRADLIPNLVEVVKGYAVHERETLERVTEARAQALGASGIAQTAAADALMTSALTGLFGVAEAYPDLKASQNFLELQRELSDAEDKIASARRYYNATVQRLNSMIQSLPSNLIASLGGFREREFYRLDDAGERAVPAVSL